jgi:hypothetical protein
MEIFGCGIIENKLRFWLPLPEHGCVHGLFKSLRILHPPTQLRLSPIGIDVSLQQSELGAATKFQTDVSALPQVRCRARRYFPVRRHGVIAIPCQERCP